MVKGSRDGGLLARPIPKGFHCLLLHEYKHADCTSRRCQDNDSSYMTSLSSQQHLLGKIR